MSQLDPIVAFVAFADGPMRPVYEDVAGQYVHDDDAEPIRGLWFIPRDLPDEPFIIDADANPGAHP